MLFWKFSKIIIYAKIVGKIPEHHLNVWLFSNPGDKVQDGREKSVLYFQQESRPVAFSYKKKSTYRKHLNINVKIFLILFIILKYNYKICPHGYGGGGIKPLSTKCG